MSKKLILEYVWIDAEDNYRSKIKVVHHNIEKKEDEKEILKFITEWTFDGSSTRQAVGTNSDVILHPVCVATNPFIIGNGLIVLCECYNANGTPHITNTRHKLVQTYEKCKDAKPLFGFEQEYVLLNKSGEMYGWLNGNIPTFNADKGKTHKKEGYYCAVGTLNSIGRQFSNMHLENCLKAGLEICGTNSEVLPSQWEYQIGPLDPISLSDQVCISRYLLHRTSELINDCVVTLDPKPIEGWNGSGGHINYSTEKMRSTNGIDEIINACEKLSLTHKQHLEVYGKGNERRLCGKYETSDVNSFSYGIADRGKSVRIPLLVNKAKCGYLEDRRPASNVDLYLATEIILRTTLLNEEK